MPEMGVGMRGIKVGIRGIRVGMAGIRVGMRGIRVGMREIGVEMWVIEWNRNRKKRKKKFIKSNFLFSLKLKKKNEIRIVIKC